MKQVYYIVIAVFIVIIFLFNKQLLYTIQHYLLSPHLNKTAKVYRNKNKSFSNYKNYSRVWAHRVNSLERYQYLLNSFDGFEIDVAFSEEKNYFDVGHSRSQSINLSFEKYLQVPGSERKSFWLDLKNLSFQNEAPILAYLDQLDSLYAIKSRIIIESNNILPLSRISSRGYFTSYYYDNKSYAELIKSGNKEQLDKIDAVSQDVKMYDVLKTRFPEKPRLTWALAFSNYISQKQFSDLDRDSLLLVYLVNIKSPYYR